MVTQMAKAHCQDVNCVAWNPKEAGLLASCSDDGDIAIWRFKEENWAPVSLSTLLLQVTLETVDTAQAGAHLATKGLVAL